MADVRFQLDEHLPKAIALQLRQRGIDTLTAHEAGLRGAADSEHVQAALEHRRVLVTEDDDFLALIATGIGHAGVAYFPRRVRDVGDFVNALVLIHGVYTAEEMVGRIEYL